MTDPDYFTRMYKRSDDPWGFTEHWYEQRKRDLTVAALPRARYRHALELGSSIGVLTEQLAPRCDRVRCVEIDPRGVEIARNRLRASAGRVTIEVGDVGTWTPEGRYDLVMVSEVLYYLDDAVLDRVCGWVDSLRIDGADVVAVHFRHPVPEHVRVGDDVHRRLRYVLGTPAASYLDTDFVLDVFRTPGAVSVAAADGLAPTGAADGLAPTSAADGLAPAETRRSG